MSDATPEHPTWPPPPSASSPPAKGLRGLGAVVAGLVLLAVAATVLVGAVVVRPRLMRVPSHSMEPTIRSGAHVLVSQNVGTISRRDVVVFRNPADRKDYVMGDNRRDAMDSRFLGAIERELIWGRWVRW